MSRSIAMLALTATAIACGGDVRENPPLELTYGPASNTLFDPPEAGGGDSIVGDWLFCRDLACSPLSGVGLRFSSDGTAVLLFTTRDAVSYCEDIGAGVARYTYDGATLVLYLRDEITSLGWEIDGDIAFITTSEGSGKAKRISPPHSIGPCSFNAPSQSGG
jgi:hypothetical protein